MKPKTWTIAIILLAGIAVRGDDRPTKTTRIYVPVIKFEGNRRQEALMMTESLIKGIEANTTSKVVGNPDEADLILEATLKPVEHAGR